MDITKTKYYRNCPKCNIQLSYSWKQSFIKAEKQNHTCYSCKPLHWLGRTHSDETKKKMSEIHKNARWTKGNLGKTFSDEHRKKISNANKGNSGRLGQPHSDETKKKMSKSHMRKAHPNTKPENREHFRSLHQQRIETRYGQITPNYNPTACQLFNEINKIMGWNGQHAEYGGEKNIRGWWADYYEPIQNIVIEYDECAHNRTHRKEKDLLKEKEIVETLGCRFYRIREGQRWQDILLGSV